MTSISILLAALVTVETGHLPENKRDHAVGNAGEVSRYQIMPGVWKRYNRKRHYSPHNGRTAAFIANEILLDRIFDFQVHVNRWPTPSETYALWNKPTTFRHQGFRVDRLPKRVRERCLRFQNVVEDIQKQQTQTHNGTISH